MKLAGLPANSLFSKFATAVLETEKALAIFSLPGGEFVVLELVGNSDNKIDALVGGQLVGETLLHLLLRDGVGYEWSGCVLATSDFGGRFCFLWCVGWRTRKEENQPHQGEPVSHCGPNARAGVRRFHIIVKNSPLLFGLN